MKNVKSAKDMAFEKERAKYRKKIRELEHDVNDCQLALMQKENELNILRNRLLQKEDWIERLLEYTELSEEDMKTLLDKEKTKAKVLGMFGELGGIMESVYRRL